MSRNLIIEKLRELFSIDALSYLHPLLARQLCPQRAALTLRDAAPYRVRQLQPYLVVFEIAEVTLLVYKSLCIYMYVCMHKRKKHCPSQRCGWRRGILLNSVSRERLCVPLTIGFTHSSSFLFFAV